MSKVVGMLMIGVTAVALIIIVALLFLWVAHMTDGEIVKVVDKAYVQSPFPRFFLYIESEDMVIFPIEVTQGEYNLHEVGDKYELVFR